MQLYPQCRNGLFPPIIVATGHVLPCCMQKAKPFTRNIRNEIIDNIFASDEHNINYKPFAEIIESSSWNNMINQLEQLENYRCQMFCGKKTITPWNQNYDELGQSQQYNRILTKDYTTLQIELTNVCTLKCLYCSRQHNPFRLNKDQLDLDKVWNAIKYKKWNRLIDCSVYGDPLWYDRLPEFLDRMIDDPPANQYSVHMAATGRGLDYWKILVDKWGKLHNQGVVVNLFFGIDGSKETSARHRINQDWDEITGALRMVAERTDIVPFLKFIPFKWNEHEIDYMMLLAEKWGAKFYLKKSERFSKTDPNRPSDPSLYEDTEYNFLVLKE